MAKEITKRPSTEVSADWQKALQEQAVRNKAVLNKIAAGAGNVLSFDPPGSLVVGAQSLPNPLPVIVLGYVHERTYYDQPYDPGRPATPACYSFDMETPHPDAPRKASKSCETCPNAPFGSGERGAQACKVALRFVAIHGTVDELHDGDYIRRASIVSIKPSALNTLTVKKVLGPVVDKAGAPYVTIFELSSEPDARTKYRIALEPVETRFDKAAQGAILSRIADAEKLATTPYPVIEAGAREVRRGSVSREKVSRSPLKGGFR